MANPYKIVARELRTRLPTAHLTPVPAMPEYLYHSGPQVDYSLIHQSYQGGLPTSITPRT